MPRWRRLWIILGLSLLGMPLVLYALLPGIAALVLQALLSQQGYQQVTLQLGYPGWHSVQIPLLTLHKDLETESLSITLRHSRLEYDLASLLAGRINRLTVASAVIALHGRSSDTTPPCRQPETAAAEPGFLARVTAGHALQRLPELPWRDLVLEQGRVFRECATGPLREVLVSGALHQRAALLEGAVTLQGQESRRYRFTFVSTPGQDLEATLQTEPAAPEPIVALHSQAQLVPAGVELTGTVAVDFTQLAPLLAFVLPHGGELPPVEGSLLAQWQGTIPATVPLSRAWQHPSTFVSGEATVALRLPKMAGLGGSVDVIAYAEVTGKATELTYRCEGTARALSPALLAVQEARGDMHGTVAMQAQHVWGTVAAVSVQFHKMGLGDVTLPAAAVHLTEALSFRANLASPAWALGPVHLDVQTPQMSWQEERVLIEQAALHLDAVHGDPAGWQTTGVLSMSGQHKATRVEGLSARFKLQATGGALSLPEPVMINLSRVQAGVEVTDIALAIQPGWASDTALAWVELRDIRAALLGGQLKSPGLRYTPGQPQQTFTVSLEHLDLQRLLQLEQQQNLQGTGVLDGVLPVILTPAGIQVQDGRLEARPPGGVLRYHPASETTEQAVASQAQLAFVMQVLANFHYTMLTMGVHYTADGTLRLAVRLEGQNPDWQQGRPIHLNLNIQENIPALLRSLQLIQGEGIRQSISERLQRR